MRKAFCLVLFTVIVSAISFAGEVRIKDIAMVKEARENQLMGFGLVVGLKRTGDSQQTEFTKQALTNLISRMGLQSPSPVGKSATNPIYNFTGIPKNQEFKSKNVAAVMVTGILPPFVKSGQKIDVTVSSLGDSSSLKGGMLISTPIQGQDGDTYAVAQGPISLGENEDSVGVIVTTVGRIPNGAMVEKDVPVTFKKNLKAKSDTDDNFNIVTFLLKKPDFTTASRVALVISKGGFGARADDAASISVYIPTTKDVISTISNIENLSVSVDNPAKVVINERTGTIVLGENTTILPVAVTFGSISVYVGEKTSKNTKTDSLVALKENSNLGDLVRSLNAIGASPKDLIEILQAIKAAGALNAEIEVL